MSEIRSGNLLIRTRGDSVEFEMIDKSASCASIGVGDIPELLEFLQAYLYSQANRRVGFRINLEPLQPHISGRFRVLIETDKGRLPATPIDLSLTGICVESDRVIAQHGAQVNAIMCFDDAKVVLPSIVVRQDGACARTAFHFLGVVKDGEPDPPWELEYIFRQLEALWLDQSLQLEWFDQDQNRTTLLHDAECSESSIN